MSFYSPHLRCIMRHVTLFLLASAVMLTAIASTPAQPPNAQRPPEYVSAEVSGEKKITFRIHAPKAEAATLGGSDIPGVGMGVKMKKGDNGVWEATVGPVPAGAYRYHFNVDGVAVIDP